MKVGRKLCLRGNALYVSIPKAMARALHWDIGSVLVVEAIGASAVRVRPIDHTDMTNAQLQPMDFELPRVATK